MGLRSSQATELGGKGAQMPPGALYFQNLVWVIILPLCFCGMLQLIKVDSSKQNFLF